MRTTTARRLVPEAISLQQAAIILGVHEDTIRRWAKSGRLEVVRVGPKLLRVPRDVIARLRRQRFEGADEALPETVPRNPLEQDVADLMALMREEDDARAAHSAPDFLRIALHT